MNTKSYGSPDNSCSKCALLWQISMMHIFSTVFSLFTFLSLCINYKYFTEKCLMIRRKNSTINYIFVLLEHTSSKWWCSQAYALLKRKIIFAASLIVSFLQKICYLETLILRYVFHRNNIYSRFYDMLTDIWYGAGLQNLCKKLLTLTVNNDIIVNISHHIMISAG